MFFYMSKEIDDGFDVFGSLLKSVDVPIINFDECKKQYQEEEVMNVTIGNICAGKQGKQHCSVRFKRIPYFLI